MRYEFNIKLQIKSNESQSSSANSLNGDKLLLQLQTVLKYKIAFKR